MTREVNYIIIEDNSEYLLIEDVGPWNIYKTITNAAEIVAEELAEQLGARRLEYIDSSGVRDQMLVSSDGKFVGFVLLPQTKKGK